MLKKSNIFNLFFLILCLQLISGNGLNIIEDSANINKTYQVDKEFELTIRNEEPFDFYNITFEEDWINLPKFSLNSGENKTIKPKITRDTNFNGQITLIGDYYTEIGASNLTEEIIIDYDNGFSKCNLDLIVGDKVTWINNVLGEVKLINSQTSQDFLTILENQNKSMTFNNPKNLNYYASWIGFQFTPICKINIMNDEGYVHNSEYDDKLNLKLNIKYEETTLTGTFYEDNYTISYNGQVEDILKIKNTGTKEAKNIHLSGEWFEFNENDFDLGAGNSKNIQFKIKPSIFSTNSTNKTHTKKIKIEGNFETIEHEINILIPYKNLDSMFSGQVDENLIYNFFKDFCAKDYDACVGLFCSVHPEECEQGQLRSDNVTQAFSSSTLRDLIEGYARLLQERQQSDKAQLEKDTEQTSKISSLENKTEEVIIKLDSIKEEDENLSAAIKFLIVFILFLGCLGILYIAIFKVNTKELIKNRFKFHKGERG